MTLRQFIARIPFIPDAKRLEWHPPFWLMRLKVLELTQDWRKLRIKLPQSTIASNMHGGIFGGFQASLADPLAALACAKVFPGYAVWTRELIVDFKHAANSDIILHFDFDDEMKSRIQADLESTGRSTPTFEMHFKRSDNTICTVIRNTVAIRPLGYTKPSAQ